jgi:hypothetical protein
VGLNADASVVDYLEQKRSLEFQYAGFGTVIEPVLSRAFKSYYQEARRIRREELEREKREEERRRQRDREQREREQRDREQRDRELREREQRDREQRERER